MKIKTNPSNLQYGEILDRNYTKAIEYFNHSAALGNTDAQFELGFMHFAGVGTTSSPPLVFFFSLQIPTN